jgi:hypothetical protein
MGNFKHYSPNNDSRHKSRPKPCKHKIITTAKAKSRRVGSSKKPPTGYQDFQNAPTWNIAGPPGGLSGIKPSLQQPTQPEDQLLDNHKHRRSTYPGISSLLRYLHSPNWYKLLLFVIETIRLDNMVEPFPLNSPDEGWAKGKLLYLTHSNPALESGENFQPFIPLSQLIFCVPSQMLKWTMA